MSFGTLTNGSAANTFRETINSNFQQCETLENKTDTISTNPSSTKYPTEKAVANYSSKIHYSSSTPATNDGDLALIYTVGSNCGKLKYDNGSPIEFFLDRARADTRTSSSWSSTNPVLVSGEIGIESDTLKMKVGNGHSSWNNLSYLKGESTENTTPTSGDNGISYGGTYSDEFGWIKFPNGLIMQWGSSTKLSNSFGNFDHAITLPTSFTHHRIYSHGTLETGIDWGDSLVTVHSRQFNLGSIRFVVDSGDLGSPVGNPSLYELHWIAIGF